MNGHFLCNGYLLGVGSTMAMPACLLFSTQSLCPCLVPGVMDNSQSWSTMEYDVSYGFFIDALFLDWGNSLLFLKSDECFHHEVMLEFVKCFSCVYLDNHVAFLFFYSTVLYSSHVVDYTDWFSDVKSTLHSHLVMVGIRFSSVLHSKVVFTYCWILFSSVLHPKVF